MKRIETVHIVGMGALGVLFGSQIYRNVGKDSVTFVMDSQRYEEKSRLNYTVNGEEIPFRLVSSDDAEACDLLIVATKYTGLHSALESMRRSIGPDTIIVSVLNGITSEKIIGERFGMEHMLYTVAQGTDAMYFQPALTYTKPGQLCLGIIPEEEKDRRGMEEKLNTVTEFLERAGIQYSVEDDIYRRMWGKYMCNVGLNQTCMVFNVGYGKVTTPGTLEYGIMVSAMREAKMLANAEGVDLTEEDLMAYVALQASMEAEAMPSMAQDRRNKKRSEVEMFSGTIRELGKKHGIEVPVNEYLYRRVHEIESAY
ncbi:MAG: ketopantoate reductase family protein [Firmicutes bacterium]|nr:ketopantoate reductase family protein [Bacillota bacterium]